MGFRVQLERDVNVIHVGFQGLFIDVAGFVKQALLDAVKGDGTVHCATIYINVSDFAGQVFGHRAFSARREAVNGNDNLLHDFQFSKLLGICKWFKDSER